MKYLTESTRWVTFYPKFNSSFFIEKAGYFDERPEVHTSVTQLLMLVLLPFLIVQSGWFSFLFPFLFLGWGRLYISLPIRTGIQDCDSPCYGFDYHNDIIWIGIGGIEGSEGQTKWITFEMPWSLSWIRTSTKIKDGSWFHETENNRVHWEEDEKCVIVGSYEWLEANKWQETHPFFDKYDNTTVIATIGVTEREWRALWFKWTSLFAKKRKTINVRFDKAVGEGKGSWKGGTFGCGHQMKMNETPLECLKRMENEKEF